MTTALKNLFTLKGNADGGSLNINSVTPAQIAPKKSGQTYQQYGYEQAGKGDATSPAYLTQGLQTVELKIRNEQRNDTARQERHKQEAKVAIAKIKQEIENHKHKIQVCEDQVASSNTDINERREEIQAIRRDPSIVGVTDGTSKEGFYFGVLILVFLSIYLFVFYGSASFSAFFKVFTPDDNAIHQAMFDPRAFSLAWRDGVAELLFILLIPFIFLALGFIIHKFQEGKSIAGYFKSALLILVTFAFDALLAFDITKKIYEVRSLNSFQEMPEYNKWMAIEDVNFWIIIFAGFIVYIIWGFVFDFTMEAHAELDKASSRIKVIEQEIKDLSSKIKEKNAQIATEREHIAPLKVALAEKEGELNHVWYGMVEIKQEVANFYSGWINYLAGLHRNTSDIVGPLDKVYNEFIKKFD